MFVMLTVHIHTFAVSYTWEHFCYTLYVIILRFTHTLTANVTKRAELPKNTKCFIIFPENLFHIPRKLFICYYLLHSIQLLQFKLFNSGNCDSVVLVRSIKEILTRYSSLFRCTTINRLFIHFTLNLHRAHCNIIPYQKLLFTWYSIASKIPDSSSYRSFIIRKFGPVGNVFGANIFSFNFVYFIGCYM